jgi:cell filamentation protein
MDEWDAYFWPNSNVLKNKAGLTHAATLRSFEYEATRQRAEQLRARPLQGQFDTAHYRAIHRHLFQDVYDWAGKLRTVEIAKDGRQFQFRRFIETGMGDVHRRLRMANFLRGLGRAEFAEAAGNIMGDVNYVHPFREGNGRAQLLYLEQLAGRAGHPLDLRRLDPQRWLAASRAAHDGDCGPMSAEITRAAMRRDRRNQDRR